MEIPFTVKDIVLGEKTANGRVYTEEIMMQAIKKTRLPIDVRQEDKVVGKVNTITVGNAHVNGELEIKSCSDKLQKILEGYSNFGLPLNVSLVGFGSIIQEGDIQYVQPDYTISHVTITPGVSIPKEK